MKNIFLLVLLISISVSQDLETLLKQAFSEHPSIKAKTAHIAGTKENEKIAGALPNPMLSGGVFIEPVVTANGPQTWRAGISQKIPFMGKLSTKRKIASKQSVKAKIGHEQTLLQIQRNVVTAYENLRFHQKEVKITNQNLELAKHIETVIKSRYKTATAGHLDLIQIQLKIMTMEDRVQDLADKEKVLLSELQYAVGTNENLFPVFNDLENTLPVMEDIGDNASLQIHKQNLEISKLQNRLNRLASLPDFTAGVDYIRLEGDSERHPLMFKAGITLPLWLGKNKALKSAGEAGLREAELQLKDTELKLNTKLSRFKFQLTEKEREIELYNSKLIPHAKLGYDASETAYLANSIPFTEFIFAFQTLLDLELKSAQAISEFQKIKAGYFELTGQFIINPEKGDTK